MSSFHLRRGIGGVVSALLALTLVLPAAVSAATPDLIPTWTVIPTTVNNGDYVAFRASIYNNDNSTVSQLFLVEIVRGTGLGAPVVVTPSQGTCDTTGTEFKCTLGQLKPRRTATVTAVFMAPAAPATSTLEVLEFNTTGLGSGSGDQSHGDAWGSGALLTANFSSDGDFGGRYVLNSNDKIVENSQALSSANPHSTRAYAPVTGIGVTVEDIDCNVTEPDPLCADLAAGFGEISKVDVNGGVDVSGTPGTTLLHFYLQLDSSEIPNTANANNVSVDHVYAGGFETIDTACTFARKATIPNNAPCITAKNLPGGDLGIDVWTFWNGGLRVSS